MKAVAGIGVPGMSYECVRLPLHPPGALANGPKRAGGLETVVLEDYAMAAKMLPRSP